MSMQPIKFDGSKLPDPREECKFDGIFLKSGDNLLSASDFAKLKARKDFEQLVSDGVFTIPAPAPKKSTKPSTPPAPEE